jgi:hypothetical protein
MAATDAMAVPKKNTAYRHTFVILDADGDPVSGAAGLDSEVSKDGAAFADCTNEATEIGTSGFYYLDLTATEMNADTVAVRVQTSTSGAKTEPIILYPEKAGDIRVNVTQWEGADATDTSATWESANYPSGTAQSATASTLVLASSDDTPDDHYIGSIVYIESGTGVGQARRIVDSTFHASTPSITVAPDWATNPSSDSVYTIYPAGLGALANLDVASSSLATATDLTTVANAVTALQGDVTDLLDVATLAAVKLGVYRLVRSGTTLTGYAEDESTVVATWTLDDADNPTSIIRAS